MGPYGTGQDMHGTRTQTRAGRWLCVLVALAVLFSGVLHAHAADHAPASQPSAPLHFEGHGQAGTDSSDAAQDCADGQAAGHACCMSTGGCAACVPVAVTSAWPAQVPAAPRPMAEQVAPGPRPLPLYRPPRLSCDV